MTQHRAHATVWPITLVEADFLTANTQDYLAVTGTTGGPGIMGSGPGYPSYDDGLLYLNGTKLAARSATVSAH